MRDGWWMAGLGPYVLLKHQRETQSPLARTHLQFVPGWSPFHKQPSVEQEARKFFNDLVVLSGLMREAVQASVRWKNMEDSEDFNSPSPNLLISVTCHTFRRLL